VEKAGKAKNKQRGGVSAHPHGSNDKKNEIEGEAKKVKSTIVKILFPHLGDGRCFPFD